MKTKAELQAADDVAMDRFQAAHLAWLDGGECATGPLKQARDAAKAEMDAIRDQLAALPLEGDALLRYEQGLAAEADQLAASQRLAPRDGRTPGIEKTQAQLDREYDEDLAYHQE